MSRVKFETNGKENGKTAYLAKENVAGTWVTFASIIHDGSDWCVLFKSGRIDRFERLWDAKDECLKR